METPKTKCSGCNKYWIPNETDIKSSGILYKTCKICRKRTEERERITPKLLSCGCKAFLGHSIGCRSPPEWIHLYFPGGFCEN